jgi:hypothetical protein
MWYKVKNRNSNEVMKGEFTSPLAAEAAYVRRGEHRFPHPVIVSSKGKEIELSHRLRKTVEKMLKSPVTARKFLHKGEDVIQFLSVSPNGVSSEYEAAWLLDGVE